jgi:hypothetical protein
MHRLVFTSVILFCSLLISCSNSNPTQNNSKLCTIKIDHIGENNEILLSDFVKKVDVLPLEFNKNCILGEIKKIQFDNDLIFIQDSQNKNGIFCFSMQGKFIRRIGTQGKGPGEHIELTGFSLNTSKKSIYIYCNATTKIIEYSYQNDYLREINSGYSADNFEYQNKYFYMYRHNPEVQEKSSLIIKDFNGNNDAEYFASNPLQRSSLDEGRFFNADSCLYINIPFNDTIYAIREKTLSYLYCIDYGKYTVNEKYRNELLDRNSNVVSILNENNLITGVDDPQRINNKLFFTYNYRNMNFLCIYNINTKEITSAWSIIDDLSFYLIDIPHHRFNNCLVGVYNPASIMANIKFLNRIKGQMVSNEKADTLIARFRNYKSHMNELNPFLVFYHVK